MEIFRRHAVLTLLTVEQRKKAFIEMSHAFGGTAVGVMARDERYDYKNAMRLAFYPVDMLAVSFRLLEIAHGHAAQLERNGLITVAYSAFTKGKILAAKLIGENVELAIVHGDDTCAMLLGKGEVYAVGMWFQFQAQKFILQEQYPDPHQ